MTAHTAQGCDLAGKILRLGAREFISKPITDRGRKLTKIIQWVLSTSETESEPRNHVSKVAESQAVLYTARSKRIVRILEVLNQRTRVGAWVAKSGPELASELGGTAGEAAVVSAIYNFRKALTDIRRTHVGVEADNQTIVCSGGTGIGSATWSPSATLETPWPL